jgi:hypothetical protein
MECIHRTEPDGTIHSICPRCYAPVGNAHQETDLERAEADHICDPVLLAYFERTRSSGAKQAAGHSLKVDPIEVEARLRTSSWRKVGALTIGIIAALLTLGLENFDSLSFGLGRILSGVVSPGLLGSMAVAGSAHAFSLWVAATFNGIFYCGLTLAASSLASAIGRRFR